MLADLFEPSPSSSSGSRWRLRPNVKAEFDLTVSWVAAIVDEIPREYWPAWVWRFLDAVAPPGSEYDR